MIFFFSYVNSMWMLCSFHKNAEWMNSLCLNPRCGIRSMGEPLSFMKECKLATNAFSSMCISLGFASSSHSVKESWISMMAGEAYGTERQHTLEREEKQPNMHGMHHIQEACKCHTGHCADIKSCFTVDGIMKDGQRWFLQSSHGMQKLKWNIRIRG